MQESKAECRAKREKERDCKMHDGEEERHYESFIFGKIKRADAEMGVIVNREGLHVNACSNVSLSVNVFLSLSHTHTHTHTHTCTCIHTHIHAQTYREDLANKHLLATDHNLNILL